MIKLCVFDLDGTLVDSERQMWMPSMKEVAKEMGKTLTHEFYITTIGINSTVVAGMLKKEFGEDFDTDAYFKEVTKRNKEAMLKGIPFTKGTLELVKYCKENGIKTCIGTSSFRKPVDDMLSINGLDKYIDDTVCGDEVSIGKPNPEIYLKCINKFDVTKDEVLIFEDGQAGGEAAYATGSRFILIPNLGTLSDDLKDKAYRVLNNIGEAIDIIEEENERTTSL